MNNSDTSSHAMDGGERQAEDRQPEQHLVRPRLPEHQSGDAVHHRQEQIVRAEKARYLVQRNVVRYVSVHVLVLTRAAIVTTVR